MIGLFFSFCVGCWVTYKVFTNINSKENVTTPKKKQDVTTDKGEDDFIFSDVKERIEETLLKKIHQELVLKGKLSGRVRREILEYMENK